MVISPVISKFAASGTLTKSSSPSKLNALRTFPESITLAPFSSVPLFPSSKSLASKSAFHQLTRSLGASTQAVSN